MVVNNVICYNVSEVKHIKTVIFFDIDNTIYANQLNRVLPGTKQLLRTLSETEDVVLGLATGRGPNNLCVIDDVLDLFTYRVLFNGAVVFKGDERLDARTITTSDIDLILDVVSGLELNLGMVGLEGDAVNRFDQRVADGMQFIRGRIPPVDPLFHHHQDIYALWVFSEDESHFKILEEKFPDFKIYPWHRGGADLTYAQTNKSGGIRKALEVIGDARLVCVGDGANDIQMVTMADIGIAMGNSRFSELKKKADHVAPHILDDRLNQLFEELGLIISADVPAHP